MPEVEHIYDIDNAEFVTFLERLDMAQRSFTDGDAGDFKKLWSHSDEVTLIGGHGGRVERGWENVAARLDWASSTYHETDRRTEVVSGCVREDFAYLVRKEVIEAQIGNDPTRRKQELRVTMVFRHEPEGWRIVHRHADSQLEASWEDQG